MTEQQQYCSRIVGVVKSRTQVVATDRREARRLHIHLSRTASTGSSQHRTLLRQQHVSSHSLTVPRRLTAGSRKSSTWLVPRHSNNMRPCLPPFFNLPEELRLMVYESLVTQHRFDITLHSSAKFATTLQPESIAPIYAASKVVHAEAIPVLEKFNNTNRYVKSSSTPVMVFV